MDFGALPPEINSARMYAGAGAAPMMAAAAAWNSLAAELSTTAASFESVITELTTEQWMGPASLSMAAAAQPFVLVGNMPDTVASLASPVTSAAAAPAATGTSLVQDTINGAVNTGAWFTTAGITSAIFLNHTLNTMPAAAAAAGAIPGAAAAALANTVTPAGIGATPLMAAVGAASSVGGLSVPAGWSTAALAVTAGATALEGSGWAVPEEASVMAGVPGAPGMAIASKGAGAYAGPRYGVKPVVMPKLVVV